MNLNSALDYGSRGCRFESYRGHKGNSRNVVPFFIIISGSILVILSEYGFLEKNMAFSFIPILIAYYLGKYSNIWLRNNWKILPNKFELSKVWVTKGIAKM